jgi:hypothetical protein
MWLYFLGSLNGKTYFPESSWTDSDVLELFTETWIESDILKDITFLEFVPVVLALAVWGNRLKNKKIKFNNCSRPGAIREKLQNVTISPAGLRKISFTIERFQKVQPHMHIRFRFCIQ